jgi:hypothetical protein
VKSTKILQFQHISHDYSNLWRSQQESRREESRLQHKTSMTSKTNINQYEPSRLGSYISNYFIMTLLIALLIALHIDFPLLGIVSDLLHFYILVLLIAFSYAVRLEKSYRCHYIVIFTSPIFVVFK